MREILAATGFLLLVGFTPFSALAHISGACIEEVDQWQAASARAADLTEMHHPYMMDVLSSERELTIDDAYTLLRMHQEQSAARVDEGEAEIAFLTCLITAR